MELFNLVYQLCKSLLSAHSFCTQVDRNKWHIKTHFCLALCTIVSKISAMHPIWPLVQWHAFNLALFCKTSSIQTVVVSSVFVLIKQNCFSNRNNNKNYGPRISADWKFIQTTMNNMRQINVFKVAHSRSWNEAGAMSQG